MRQIFAKFLGLTLIAVFTLTPSLSAQEDYSEEVPAEAPPPVAKRERSKSAPKKKKEELPQKGVLSTTSTKRYAGTEVSMPWGGTDQAGETQPPISGSVSQASADVWLVKVVNSSDKHYSFDVKVSQYSEKGNAVKTDFFSYSLGPKESSERNLKKVGGATDAQLSLEGWKERKKANPKKAAKPVQPNES